MEVVERYQAQSQNLFRLNEMPNITTTEFPAGSANAIFFDRSSILGVLRVFQIERSGRSKCCPIARETCGQDAIEHVDPTPDHLEQLWWRADPSRNEVCFLATTARSIRLRETFLLPVRRH